MSVNKKLHFHRGQANETQPSLHIKEVPGNTARRRFLAGSSYITHITPPLEEQCIITVSLPQEDEYFIL